MAYDRRVAEDLPLIDVAPLLAPDGDPPRWRGASTRRADGSGSSASRVMASRRRSWPSSIASPAASSPQPEDVKADIAMAHGGSAWRGWFPLDGELTSGRPDHKEGLYFGTELAADHPAVVAGRPLHGANLFPASVPELRPAVLGWIDAMAALGAALLRAIAVGLGLDGRWFARHVTADPTVLFRIFRYPPDRRRRRRWGVAEHTDYGLLTILATDDHDGLQVHAPDGWIDVPSDPGVFVVNLGDMLDRMTEGRYRSTPHRVRNTSGAERLSFPCFIDPSWDATCPVLPLAGTAPADDADRRWDGRSVRGVGRHLRRVPHGQGRQGLPRSLGPRADVVDQPTVAQAVG